MDENSTWPPAPRKENAEHTDIVLYPAHGTMFLIAVFALSRLLRPRPSLIIDNVGITDNASALGAGLIRWEEIEGARMTSAGRSRFIIITLRDPEAVLARQLGFKRGAMRTNLGMMGSPVLIPGHTTMPLEDILRHIQSRGMEHHA